MTMHRHVYLLTLPAILSIMLFFNLFARWMATTHLFQSPASDTKISRQSLLRLNEKNEFHIAIFSDLHYGEEEDGWGIISSTPKILTSSFSVCLLPVREYHVFNEQQMEI
jgi:hypothetical protein